MLPQNPQKPDEPYTPLAPTTPEISNSPKPEPEVLSASIVDAEPRTNIEIPSGNIPDPSSVNSAEPIVAADASYVATPPPDVTEIGTPSIVSEPVNVPLHTEGEPAFNPMVVSKKKRNKWLILGVIFAALTVLLGGTYAAYALWYSSPTKVAADAAHQLITNKTAVTAGTILFESGVDSDQTKVEVSFSSKLNNADINGQADARLKITGPEKKTYEVNGAGLLSASGAFYFKFDGVAKLIDQYMDDETIKEYVAANPQLKIAIDAFIKKIDGVWIKIDQELIREYAKNFDYNKTKQCFQKSYDAMLKDSGQQNQLREVYAKNEFLQLTPQGTQSINGAWTNKYAVTTNLAKGYDAVIAYEKTDFAKASNDCMKDFQGDSESTTTKKPSNDEIREIQQEIDKAKITVYIASFGHELKRVEVNYAENDSKTSVASQFDMSSNVPVDTKDPAKSIPLKEFQADIEKIQNEFYGSTTNAN